jgi:hypothetical protein
MRNQLLGPRNALENPACDPQPRYRWSKSSDLPDRKELIDRITSQRAAIIVAVNRQFDWKCNTSMMFHGAPPTEGTCTTLLAGKRKVMSGLQS